MRRRPVRTAAGAGILALALAIPAVATFASTDPPAPPGAEYVPQPALTPEELAPHAADSATIAAAMAADNAANGAQPALTPEELAPHAADRVTVAAVMAAEDAANGAQQPALTPEELALVAGG